MTDYRVEGKTVAFNNGKEITFIYEIGDTVYCNRVVAVRLIIPTDVVLNENIYGYTTDGDMLWQIEKVGLPYVNSPYTGLWCEAENFMAYNWSGFELTLDPQTGKVISRLFTK